MNEFRILELDPDRAYVLYFAPSVTEPMEMKEDDFSDGMPASSATVMCMPCDGSFWLPRNRMSFLANRTYGVFAISDRVAESVPEVLVRDFPCRANVDVIKALLSEGSDYVSGLFARLALIVLPENVHVYNWDIVSWDGFERVVYWNKKLEWV